MTYNHAVVFIETSHFTRLLQNYLSEEEYRKLQEFLMNNPAAGRLIPGSGGLRKLRWARPGVGKSGGIRTIYYWAKSRDQIYLLTIYSKSEKENISTAILLQIAKHLEEIK